MALQVYLACERTRSRLQDLLLQRQVRDQSLQPSVLPFLFIEALHFLDIEAAILFAPAAIALLGELLFLADLNTRSALRHRHVDLAQLHDRLLGVVPFFRHLRPSFPT